MKWNAVESRLAGVGRATGGRASFSQPEIGRRSLTDLLTSGVYYMYVPPLVYIYIHISSSLYRPDKDNKLHSPHPAHLHSLTAPCFFRLSPSHPQLAVELTSFDCICKASLSYRNYRMPSMYGYFRVCVLSPSSTQRSRRLTLSLSDARVWFLCQWTWAFAWQC